MAEEHTYRLVEGNSSHVNMEIAKAARDGWKPILMTTIVLGQGAWSTIVLEKVSLKIGS
jgi:hypothetical protein